MCNFVLIIACFAISPVIFAQPYVVLKVLNGGTVVLDVDSVETTFGFMGVHTSYAFADGPAPVNAGFFLNDLLAGENVYIEYPEQPMNRSGRKIKLVYLYRYPDSLFINQEMIRAGQSNYKNEPGDKYEEIFRYWQAHAKEHFKGIWNINYSKERLPFEYRLYKPTPRYRGQKTLEYVKYELPVDGYVSVVIVDDSGQIVVTLFEGYKPAGSYTMGLSSWKLPEGNYRVKLEAKDILLHREFVMLKP